jgi:hypothetical protein
VEALKTELHAELETPYILDLGRTKKENCIKNGIVLKNKSTILAIITLLTSTHLAAADMWPIPMHQPDTLQDSIQYTIGVSAIAASGNAPFWFHAMQNGDISTAPYSGNLKAAIYKPATRPNRWYDYDFGVSLTGRFDTEQSTAFFNELYAHVRLYIIDITAGVKPLITGAQNPELSTGGLLFSRNAHAFPRVTIGIDHYTAIPGLYGYLELRGGITQGWMVDNSYLDTTIHTTNTMLHHKFIGLQAGGRLPINISYEFHHAAQWGGKSPTYGELPRSWDSFKRIFFAQEGGGNLNDKFNAEGNHIGLQEFALTAKWDKYNITAYWQTIFEDKSADFIGRSNQEDGLWGISFRQSEWPYIHTMTYEFMNSTQQNGPLHDQDGLVYGGCNDYYSNAIYKQGWTHFGRTLGNSMMSPNNNRVRTHFLGLMGDIYSYHYKLVASYTRNWGTYKNPIYSHNTSLLLEVRKRFEKAWGIEIGGAIGVDLGTQWGNTIGGQISICKQGLIHQY